MTFSGNRRWDRNARERWKAHGNGCAVGRKAKWVRAEDVREGGQDGTQGRGVWGGIRDWPRGAAEGGVPEC